MSDRFDHTLEHTFDTKPDGGGGEAVTSVRRIELITGAGRRRQWSENDKARVVIESLKPGANVSEVARRNGLSPQQLFCWRREARALMAEEVGASNAPASEQARSCPPCKPQAAALESTDHGPAFASVVIAAPSPAPPSPPSSPAPPVAEPATTGRIEITLLDAIVRVTGPVEPATLTAVIRAIRRAT
jgi:transposase